MHALFLAVSWTWCIGMFLPVLLVRDFGLWGFVAFAVPNVVGAASVGFLLRSRDAADRFAAEHHLALHVFSLVTIAFHAWFLGAMALRFGILRTLFGPDGPAETTATALGAAGLLLAAWAAARRASFRSLLLLAPAVLALSIAAAALAQLTTGGRSLGAPPLSGDDPFPAVLLAAPALALGFLTCPYLDATLLRVRRELDDRAARRSFAIGFAGPFLLMVLLTLLYAHGFNVSGVVSWYILLHFSAQAMFTAAAHTRELWATADEHARRTARPTPPWRRWIAPALIALFAALGAAGPRLGLPFEVGYQSFLFWYAVVFPAYLLATVATRRRPGSWKPRLAAAAAATLLAGPVFAFGYLTGRWPLVCAGAAGVAAIASGAAAALARAERSAPHDRRPAP